MTCAYGEFCRDSDFGGRCGQYGGIVQIDALAVHALRLEKVGWQGDGGVARAADRHDLFNRIGEQFVFADRLVGQLMDKAAVRAIFQQAADEIGKQVAVAADGRVGPAMIALLLHQPFEKPLAHAVQPLELKITPVARPMHDGRDGQRVVARQRGADVRGVEHVAGAGKVGHVGRRLAREEREIAEPAFLRMLDLAVPIGALHQPHLQDPARFRA